jgi:hypothetical protein
MTDLSRSRSRSSVRSFSFSSSFSSLSWHRSVASLCVVAGLGFSVGACSARASSAGAAFPTQPLSALSGDAGSAVRVPDGVIAAPVSGSVAGEASALSADGSVALRPPLALEGARLTVLALLHTYVEEDFDGFRDLVLADATTYNPLVGSGANVSLIAAFRERIRRLNYRQLAGVPLALEGDMEVYSFDELSQLAGTRPEMPPGMQRGDAFVRARIVTPRVGPERYFGDNLDALLRATPTGWVVVSVAEEMPMP